MPNYDQPIYNNAIKAGFTPTSAKLIVAQSRLESADYTSNVFKNNNNMFGMKFVGQPLATKGTLAPESERSCGGNCNSDYYAKYNTPADSARDLTERLFKITRNGIGFNDIKNSTDALDYAIKLKKRGYFGATAQSYAAGLNAKLKKIDISGNNTGAMIIGIGLLLTFFLHKI